MTHRNNNVLRVNATEERDSYRAAVSEILLNVQRDHGITLRQIADQTDISLGTISNAANRNADLSATYLRRLGDRYGAHYLDPFARLAGGRMVPRETDSDGDILPVLMAAGHKIATARCPSSPAGSVETLAEQLGYLPELRRLRRDLDALIAMVENRRDAA